MRSGSSRQPIEPRHHVCTPSKGSSICCASSCSCWSRHKSVFDSSAWKARGRGPSLRGIKYRAWTSHSRTAGRIIRRQLMLWKRWKLLLTKYDRLPSTLCSQQSPYRSASTSFRDQHRTERSQGYQKSSRATRTTRINGRRGTRYIPQ